MLVGGKDGNAYEMWLLKSALLTIVLLSFSPPPAAADLTFLPRGSRVLPSDLRIRPAALTSNKSGAESRPPKRMQLLGEIYTGSIELHYETEEGLFLLSQIYFFVRRNR